MLGLRQRTGADWVERVTPHLDALLIEQAHLEKKAASAALTLLFRYPEHACLQRPLSAIAREELEHFERTLDLLERRGLVCGRLRPGPYAERLLEVVRADEPARLLDQMLCAAVIEARSCDRMKALADGLRERDPELAAFYHDLVLSEARHHGAYLGLCRELFDPSVVDARLDAILDHEADVIARAGGTARLHD